MTRSVLTAGGLGVGWFVVLLLPGVTRSWLLESPLLNAVLLPVAGLATFVIFRRFIAGAPDFRGHVLRAATVPYAGCVVYLTLFATVMWGKTLLFGGLANLHDTMSLYLMGLTAAAVSFYVVVPYGLACQLVMHRTLRTGDADGQGDPDG